MCWAAARHCKNTRGGGRQPPDLCLVKSDSQPLTPFRPQQSPRRASSAPAARLHEGVDLLGRAAAGGVADGPGRLLLDVKLGVLRGWWVAGARGAVAAFGCGAVEGWLSIGANPCGGARLKQAPRKGEQTQEQGQEQEQDSGQIWPQPRLQEVHQRLGQPRVQHVLDLGLGAWTGRGPGRGGARAWAVQRCRGSAPTFALLALPGGRASLCRPALSPWPSATHPR